MTHVLIYMEEGPRRDLSRKLSRLMYKRGHNARALYSFLVSQRHQLHLLSPEGFAYIVGLYRSSQ